MPVIKVPKTLKNRIRKLFGLRNPQLDSEMRNALQEDFISTLVVLAIKAGLTPAELVSLKKDKKVISKYLLDCARAETMEMMKDLPAEFQSAALHIREILNKIELQSETISQTDAAASDTGDRKT